LRAQLGAKLDENDEVKVSEEQLEHRLALISGTSSCHMCVSREPLFIEGIWGPYYSAMIPDLWLTEGGQSATGNFYIFYSLCCLLSI
jgi:ribulose kinase